MTRSDRRTFLKHGAGAAAAVALAPNLDLFALPRVEEPIDVAVIGVGRQGRSMLVELAKIEGVKVAALCDLSESRLRSGARRAAGAQTFSDYRELLDKATSVGAVFVATPTHQHAQICLDAIAAGKHVFCEAPLASTLEDCRKIVAASRGAKTVFHTGMQGRSNPIYGLARSFVRSGAIRDVGGMRAQYHKKTSWRFPGPTPEEEAARNWRLDPEVSIGLAGEMGVHQFDVFHWFLNSYPTSVRGRGSIQLHEDGREVHDTIGCELTFPGDRQLFYDATLANSFDGTHEVFHGQMGTIKLSWTAGWMFKEADAPTQGWEVYANREYFHNEEGITLIADATKLAAQDKLKEGVGLPEPPLYYALADFLKSATEEKPVVCTASEGLRAAAVAISAHRALTSGETVTIDPDVFEKG